MQFEVELKFQLEDVPLIETNLKQLGAVEQDAVSHVDRYFNHPSRDFRTTDEAFRIRSVNNKNCVTYKGAIVGHVAKTRHEIEIGFDEGKESAEQLVEMVKLLGFRFVREVRKTRRTLVVDRNDRRFEVALDDVPPLGNFLEIEIIADENDRKNAENSLWELAHLLGLSDSLKRSYLDLLLEMDNLTKESHP